ncbi:LysR family transcriptional regulator [Clostridium sp. PL3]|uniref:LysR family transcriptional regulator n=1 Tax=Clostridium thailandense TaxID=2794346 RepID=A0A949WW66_9CLOT|nr:LysR family transcriptional regulator [Clostridium thailandense]MBV7274462.1 LysR family transcriptional regulator [Clostridium thailandense]
MDIRQLQYFIAVAEHLNFTETAKHLYVAQSAVSYQIAALEKDLGVKLFIRDKHLVRLTSAGKVLLKEAIAIMDRFNEAVQKTQQAATGILGNLRIGLLGVRVISVLPELLRSFRVVYPSIGIDLEQMNAGQITEALENGDIDLGFTRSFSVHDNPNLTWKKVYTDSIQVVLPYDHPMANQTSIDISELANESFISVNRQHSAGIFDLLINLCSSRGFSPNIVSRPHHVETVLCLIEAGMGISILPHCFNNCSNPNLKYIDIEGNDAYIDLVVAWNKNASNKSIPLFLKELENYDIKVQ